MGKGKAKKPKPTVIGDEFLDSTAPCCSCDHGDPRAADGHNVDGWTDEDIRIYNELLTERAKLEREKNELEQKSARHQAERALLNEDAAAFDSLFKMQLGGEYKFTGTTYCCVDFETGPKHSQKSLQPKCHHEVCSRAKAQGISWMELDTIKYYQSRISMEKSQRMKNALRKQRDVELERVKKDDEEEAAVRERRSAMNGKALKDSHGDHLPPVKGLQPGDFAPALLEAFLAKGPLLDPKDSALLEAAKQNEVVVNRIRTRLDKIRQDVHLGKVTASDARVKLDQANKEMAEAERKNNSFKELVWSTGTSQDSVSASALSYSGESLSQALSKSLTSAGGDSFAQALSVMKGFFSASDPRDVQAAITELRSVLELNGPPSPVLQKSLQALQDLLGKPKKKFKMELTMANGTKRTCTDDDELCLALRYNPTRESRDKIKQNLHKGTWEANQMSMAVEEHAKNAIERMSKALHDTDAYKVYDSVCTLKDKAVKRSFFPWISERVLEEAMSDMLFQNAALALISHALTGANEKRLSAMATPIVFAYSGKNPEKYRHTCSKLLKFTSESQEKLNDADTRSKLLEFTSESQQQIDASIYMLRSALIDVKDKMGKFAVKQLRAQQAGPPKSSEQDTPQSLIPDPLQVDKQANPLQSVTLGELARDNPNLDPTSADMTLGTFQEVIRSAQENRRRSTAAAEDKAKGRAFDKEYKEILDTMIGTEDSFAGVEEETSDTQRTNNEKELANQDSAPKFDSAPIRRAYPESSPYHASKFQEYFNQDVPPVVKGERGDTKPDPPPYIANEGRTRTVRVKQVPVKTPEIQNQTQTQVEDAVAPNQSKKKAATKAKATTKPDSRADAEVPAAAAEEPAAKSPSMPALPTAPSPTPASEHEGMCDRERSITRHLINLKTSLSRLARSAGDGPAELGPLGLGDAFGGIASKLAEQLEGHKALARCCVEANGWWRLQRFLDEELDKY